MFQKARIGICADLNPLKKRLLENPACCSSVTFSGNRKKADTHEIIFEFKNDVFALEQFFGILAEYILDYYEPPRLERLLCEEYPTLPQASHREILRCAKHFDDDPDIGRQVRRQAVLLSLYDYFRENSDMLLEGFVTFRLKEYETLLESLAERSAEEYITKHEYEDFIDLLKYFVALQENRPALLHLVIAPNGSYTLLSENGENITERCMADFIDTKDFPVDAGLDDLLISMLITLAPRQITLHHGEYFSNKELLETIHRVFDGHVTLCRDCKLCCHV